VGPVAVSGELHSDFGVSSIDDPATIERSIVIDGRGPIILELSVNKKISSGGQTGAVFRFSGLHDDYVWR
jgi:hypothetical protein